MVTAIGEAFPFPERRARFQPVDQKGTAFKRFSAMTCRCRDEDDPVAGFKRANAVDNTDAQQSPARYRFPPQFLKSPLRHVRIMVEVKFNQTAIPANQSSETRHRSATSFSPPRTLPSAP